MRDLSDYRAEIFRRSEEKIKERKRARNRALAFCIPLCLVFTVVAFAKLPDIPFLDISAENVSSDSDTLFVQMEIQNSESKLQTSVVNTDADEVEEIYLLIQSAFETTAQEEPATDDFSQFTDTSNKVVQDSLPLFSSSEYRVVFTSKSGETFSYTLNGNKLTDNTTKEKIKLSNEQSFKLQSKLGLIIKWEEE